MHSPVYRLVAFSLAQVSVGLATRLGADRSEPASAAGPPSHNRTPAALLRVTKSRHCLNPLPICDLPKAEARTHVTSHPLPPPVLLFLPPTFLASVTRLALKP